MTWLEWYKWKFIWRLERIKEWWHCMRHGHRWNVRFCPITLMPKLRICSYCLKREDAKTSWRARKQNNDGNEELEK
jgi:hypothetical protein